jgi:hypothetical protein
MAAKKKKVGRGDAAVKLGRHFARIARAPLKRQGTSDAWNERANKLVASRTAAKLLIKGTIEQNKARAAKKKRKKRGAKSTK